MTPANADNARIAAVFEEIANLLEVQGENPFRIRAYRDAARIVGALVFPGIEGVQHPSAQASECARPET